MAVTDVEIVTLTEALQRLKNANKKDLYVRLEKYERGKYIIPMNFVSMLVGTQNEGKVYEHAAGGLQGQVVKNTDGLLIPQQIPHGIFGWAGAPGAVPGPAILSQGFRVILFLFTQPTWTVAPATISYSIEFSMDGVNWFTNEAGEVGAIGVTNLSADWELMYHEIAAGIAIPLGEFAPYWRIVITTVGAGTSGDMVVESYGVTEI